MKPTPDDGTIGSRIARAIEQSDSPDPHNIAQGVIHTLTYGETQALALEALVARVRSQIGERRSGPHHLPRRGSRIEWPSDDDLSKIVEDEGTFLEAAEKLGVGRKTLTRRCHERGIYDAWDRRSWEWDRKLEAEIGRVTSAFAADVRAEGIKLGLEQASVDRVCVDGEWMFLADCTSRDLRVLADEYVARSSSNAQQGAYYLALAEQLDEGGFSTVRAMCDA